MGGRGTIKIYYRKTDRLVFNFKFKFGNFNLNNISQNADQIYKYRYQKSSSVANI